MRLYKTLLPFIGLSLLCGCGSVFERALLPSDTRLVLASPEAAQRGEVVPHSYIVVFKGENGSAKRRFASFLLETQHSYQQLASTLTTDSRIAEWNHITTVNLANPKDPEFMEEFSPPPSLRLLWDENDLDELPGLMTSITFTDDQGAQELLKGWAAEDLLWFAEPNYLNRLADNPYTEDLANSYADAANGNGDGRYNSFWWHASIKLPQALAKLAANPPSTVSTPVIAVLDSGVDIEHPLLKNHIWENDQPGAADCADDIYGCDTTTAKKGSFGSGGVYPYGTTGYGQSCPGTSAEEDGVCGHGTHVSGIIAADIDLEQGAGGVCPSCRIMPIKIIAKDTTGKGTASDVAILNGFKYLTQFRVKQGTIRIANSSFGKYSRSRAVGILVNILKRSPNEVLVVGAASNDDSMVRSYPAAFSDAIAVSAIGPDDGKATYSNFGPWVDVAAPGGDGGRGLNDIVSTLPGGGVGAKRGTSMASPVVAGVAGLVLAADPNRSFSQLRASIINTADPRIYAQTVYNGINYNYYYPKPQGDTSRLPLLGAGVVDAEAAIEGTKKTGIGQGLIGRVDSSCGTVRLVSGSWWGTLLFFLLPVLVLAVYGGRYSDRR